MAGEYDLQISGGDLVFGADGEPVFLSGVPVIAQDVAHRIAESGAAVALVAEDANPEGALARIAAVAEEDERIQPGTAKAEPPDATGYVKITALSLDGQTITT